MQRRSVAAVSGATAERRGVAAGRAAGRRAGPGRPASSRPLALFILATTATTAWGQEASYELGPVLVTAPSLEAPLGAPQIDSTTLDALRPSTSDTAALLQAIPGVSLQGAGGVSSLPVIHGLADDRVRTTVDGVNLMPACPNHMNPALSYIDPTSVAAVRVYAGITPVSVGGDSIGGTVEVESPKPRFAEPGKGPISRGRVGTFYRSNGNAWGADAEATLASDSVSVTYRGATAQSDNYTAGGDFKTTTATGRSGHTLPLDEVGSTAYRSINQSLEVAARGNGRLLDLRYAHQHIPYEAFPNQRMDMTGNDSDSVNLGYQSHYGWGELKARLYRQATDHQMQFGDDKMYWYGSGGTVPGMPMNTRAKNTGARLKADIKLAGDALLRVGGEYQHYTLDDWWPPSGGMMAPDTFWNINDGRRDRMALFGEWEGAIGPRWTATLGVRHETVESDTGDVQGYAANNMKGSNQLIDATRFNALAQRKRDQNWDLAALARFTPSATRTYAFGIAQKSRSPNLYERYAWSTWPMAAVMNNFTGDGNGYVGNPALKPEVAETVSASADWHDAGGRRWALKVRPYYTYVHNYIDARCLPGTTCIADRFNVLQYVNQSAELYGIDLSGHVPFAGGDRYGALKITGVVSYVRGRNRTTGDNLYNIMPLNATLALVQRYGHWTNRIETRFVDAKREVSAVRNEVRTAGYSLVNLRSGYAWKGVRLAVGVDNLFDRFYNLPLGGAYVGQGKTMSENGVPWGVAVPGPGRSVYTSVQFSF